jgi:hypothetical protein
MLDPQGFHADSGGLALLLKALRKCILSTNTGEDAKFEPDSVRQAGVVPQHGARRLKGEKWQTFD